MHGRAPQVQSLQPAITFAQGQGWKQVRDVNEACMDSLFACALCHKKQGCCAQTYVEGILEVAGFVLFMLQHAAQGVIFPF